ncbi:hypothetical protein OIE13_22800 [Streptosporangium sp. NBC_01810]|uniref:hypothetical protein n=1 Tax=Streptosporangium sp. NBC_01810 TaxID=2975951 RepID=UPI002DDB490F|nr:hypothetical protein [Streptosporangium sp. NBC_01810]WSA23775.1 hypothetical protein OIE13_22800 [Streptosporangium sp. NBC_01810]
MLDMEQRMTRYLTQTGRNALTPRQSRRVQKKERGQSLENVLRREGVAIVRRSEAERRKARRAGLTPAPN